MISLSALQAKNTKPEKLLLQGRGYGLWTAWAGDLNPVFVQTLEDYGGIKVLEDESQALWFFFNEDVFLAAAKLGVWSQFNSLPVTMQIFEAGIECSPKKHFYIDIADNLWQQTVDTPVRLQVFFPPQMLGSGASFAGITLGEAPVPPGFSGKDWRLAVMDQRRQYQPSRQWYCVLKPVVGNHDRAYQIRWRDFYERLIGLMQRSKLKHNVQDNFVLLSISSLRQLGQWCRDYLHLIDRMKTDGDGSQYWPTVMAVVEGKGLPLNSELPGQIGLDWDALAPDSPYLSLQNAILMGEQVVIHESRIARGSTAPEAWCTIVLAREDGGEQFLQVPDLSPSALVAGEHEYCFYCGQRSHATVDCPSKLLKDVDLKLWNKISAMNLEDMEEGVRELNSLLRENPAALENLLDAGSPAGNMARAVFSVGTTFQQRSIPLFWRIRGKSYPQALSKPIPEDDSPIWDFIKTMGDKDLDALDKELQNLEVRYPRDYRVFSIRGFVAMEMKNFVLAKKSWEEAHLLSHPGIMQAWHFLLLGRLAEYQGAFVDARQAYDKALETTPNWVEGKYRRLICMIKSGFIEQAMPLVISLVREEPIFFYWFLMDPEAERAATQLIAALSKEWTLASDVVGEEKLALGILQKELRNWFLPDHEFLLQAEERVQKLLDLSSVHNYVAYMAVLRGRTGIEKDMQIRINMEIKDLKARFNTYVRRLNHIRDEAAWFPFPKALVEFNKNFNAAATNLSWIMRANMHVADIFRKALELNETERERLEKMEKRLKMLRIIRDGTLFALVLVKRFLWMEIAGLALILVVLPLVLLYGNRLGLTWISEALMEQRWEIQKGAIILVSLLVLMVSGLWTVLRFEVIRDKIFEKARQDEAKKAKDRADKLEKILKTRSAKRKRALDAAKAGQGRK